MDIKFGLLHDSCIQVKFSLKKFVDEKLIPHLLNELDVISTDELKYELHSELIAFTIRRSSGVEVNFDISTYGYNNASFDNKVLNDWVTNLDTLSEIFDDSLLKLFAKEYVFVEGYQDIYVHKEEDDLFYFVGFIHRNRNDK